MSQTTPESRLKALECHFTWDLEANQSLLGRIRAKLEDAGTEEGNPWLGHIYNMRGFIQYKLGVPENAQSLFSQAAEAFSQMRRAEDGPWLVVNYGNLAWLHHHLGDPVESQAYLMKMDHLMEKYPPPSQEQLHAETYAEKAWTLMKFRDRSSQAADCFQRAIDMKPDMVEWNTSHVLCLASPFKRSDAAIDDDILEKLRVASENDPENLYVAAVYLDLRSKRGERVGDEARELGRKILMNPVSNYRGLKAILRVYRSSDSVDEAIDLAEEALNNHPDERYLKRCLALTYKWKILFFSNNRPDQRLVQKEIALLREVIALYPHSSLLKEVDLANMYAKSRNGLNMAEQKYQELLERDVEAGGRQLIYNYYAKYLNYDRRDHNSSLRYHMKAAEIPHQSYYRENSINILEKVRDKGRHRMCGEIDEFLRNLEEPSLTG